MATTVWRGQLTFGLVSIPVRLSTAARKERLRLHYLRKTASKTAPIEQEPDDRPSAPSQEGSRGGAPVSRQESEYGGEPGNLFRPEPLETSPLAVTRVQQEL